MFTSGRFDVPRSVRDVQNHPSVVWTDGASRGIKRTFLLPRSPAFLFTKLLSPISIFAPAKLNLFLAVTGRRDDGFHDLVSVVAQLEFGDTLRVTPATTFSLRCTDPA